MKKILAVAASVLALSMLAGCATKGNKADKVVQLEQVYNQPQVIDHKGVAFGLQQPAWVAEVIANSTNQKAMAKALGLDNDKIWVVYGTGPDLEFLRTWIDQVDARAEIAASIQQTIVDTVEAQYEGKKDGNAVENKAEAKRVSERAANVTVSGLEKAQDWWTKTRQLKLGGNKNEAGDYEERYTYIVVYTMDMNQFKKQMNDSLDTVLEGVGTEMSGRIRELLMEKVETRAGITPKEKGSTAKADTAAPAASTSTAGDFVVFSE